MMKLKYLAFIMPLCLLILSVCSSCKEFIEPSIDKSVVRLNAPANDYHSTKYAINFWWDEVEDALTYRLQVVTPGFDSIGALVLDTVVRSSKFTVNLDPGTYEWRVQAANGSSATGFSTPEGFVVEESSLTGQALTLSLPANNTLTNKKDIVFKWNSLFGATKYHVQIDTNNFADQTSLVYDQAIPGAQLSFKLPKDQAYAWRVRAENETEQSNWSAVNYITYDGSPPATVSLLSPDDQALIPTPVSLKWNTATGATQYKVYVYQSDGVTPVSNIFPILQNTTAYVFNTGISGSQYFWKVTALDAAGNEGTASPMRSFTIL